MFIFTRGLLVPGSHEYLPTYRDINTKWIRTEKHEMIHDVSQIRERKQHFDKVAQIQKWVSTHSQQSSFLLATPVQRLPEATRAAPKEGAESTRAKTSATPESRWLAEDTDKCERDIARPTAATVVCWLLQWRLSCTRKGFTLAVCAWMNYDRRTHLGLEHRNRKILCHYSRNYAPGTLSAWSLID